MIKIFNDVCVDPKSIEYMTVKKVLVSYQFYFSTKYQVQVNMKDNKVFESQCYDTKEEAKKELNKLLEQINREKEMYKDFKNSDLTLSEAIEIQRD